MRAAQAVGLAGAMAACLVTLAHPVEAGEANATSDTSGISARANDGDQRTGTGAAPGGRSATTPMCTPGDGEPGPVSWRPVDEQYLTPEQRERVAAEGGGWYWRYCGDRSDVKVSGTDNGAVWFPAGGARPPVDPGALATQAMQRTPLPEPMIRMSPQPPIPLLVGLPTYLWVDPGGWEARTASASAGGVTSTVTAVPVQVRWDMGQGDVVTCDGPGRPYTPGLDGGATPPTGACTFTYRFSSARARGGTFTVSATVRWHATWSASGAPGGGDLGAVERTSTLSVQVAEIQTLNANPRANS